MDLWILCAEKSNLIKVDNIYIEEFFDNKLISYYEIRTKKYDDEVCLACFSDKERAFNVIQEIKDLLAENILLLDKKSAIYEMPKE